MDFITSLPSSFGYSVIYVVINRLCKYAHFFRLKANFTYKKVVEVFMANVVKIHGIPKTIMPDKDMVFVSSFWSHLFKLQRTTLAMSLA